jgi:C-terminal processing protease CtpA/Prc
VLEHNTRCDSRHKPRVFRDRRITFTDSIFRDGVPLLVNLREREDGRYTVIGVPEYAGKPAVPDVKAGDVLIMIHKVPAKGSTMGQIWSLLGGDPGETRVLTLERDGKQFAVNATARRFLPKE